VTSGYDVTVTELSPVPEPIPMRASNADRERVAQVLNVAMADGRLDVHELQERLDVVYGAKTLAELEPVTRDLPGHHVSLTKGATPVPVPGSSPAPVPPRIGGGWTSTMSVAIMSGADRKGDWVVPPKYTAVAVMGGIELDLTEARYGAAEVTINVVAIMGGIEITVPDDVGVIVEGIGVMGGFTEPATTVAPPGAPIVRVTGLALMGGVDVKRPKKKKQKKQLIGGG